MQKDQAYHEAAILYNESLAGFAENLAPTLKHEEIQRWCVSVGKQHRFHAKRHRSALNKILLKQTPEIVEIVADGLDVPEPSVDAEVSASVTEVEEILEPTPEPTEVTHYGDGCSVEKGHRPLEPHCEFNPNKMKENADG